MSEKRYFYTDPLAAAWMAMVHGFKMRVKLRCGTFCAMGDWLVMAEREKYFQRAVIHSDSLPLLEPRNGDIVAGTYHQGGVDYPMAGIVFISRPAFSSKPIVDLVWTESDYPHAYHGEPIIRRDGKAFHWPESEAA